MTVNVVAEVVVGGRVDEEKRAVRPCSAVHAQTPCQTATHLMTSWTLGDILNPPLHN